MKTPFFIAFLFSISISNSYAQFLSSKIAVQVKSGKVKLNKKDVSKDWMLTTFISTLDTFSRKKEGSNRVHTYDNLGIVLFEPSPQKKASGFVSEFQIVLDEIESSSITPKNFYEGKLVIEKLDFTRNINIEEIRKKLVDFKELETDEDDKYRFSKDGIYIYFLFNKYKKLSKIAFGKDKLFSKS